MDQSLPITNNELKYLISNHNEPLIFKNIIISNLLQWNLDDWRRALKKEVLEFRRGKFIFTKIPQWQGLMPVQKGSFDDFLKEITEPKQNEWLYFDYKYLKDWFLSVEDLRNSISWASLGFPDITANDCTIWIGSKGAHTPCHKDTYGCNLVLQVYGKKLWLMFPPEENLKSTRVPYEESSIYSKLNFFSPSWEDVKGLSNARKVILNPGDVLLVPNQWWHYVENLETSISINVWLPLPKDNFERVKESVVQLLIKQISKDLSQQENDIILNPNMKGEINAMDLKQMLHVIKACKNSCTTHQKRLKVEEPEQSQSNIFENYDPECIINKYNCVKVPVETTSNLLSFLKNQKERFVEKEKCLPCEDSNSESLIALIDVLTDSEVVSLISHKIILSKEL